jgi:hypothetical protein
MNNTILKPQLPPPGFVVVCLAKVPVSMTSRQIIYANYFAFLTRDKSNINYTIDQEFVFSINCNTPVIYKSIVKDITININDVYRLNNKGENYLTPRIFNTTDCLIINGIWYLYEDAKPRIERIVFI